MRHILLGLCLLLPVLSLAQEEIQPTEYSHAEFFQMIEDEPSDVFRLSDAVLIYDSLTDQRFINSSGDIAIKKDTIFIEKELILENVMVDWYGNQRKGLALSYLSFKKQVRLNNCNLFFNNSNFKEYLSIRIEKTSPQFQDSYYGENGLNMGLVFSETSFKGGVRFINLAEGTRNDLGCNFSKNEFYPIKSNRNGGNIFRSKNAYFYLDNNVFHGNSYVSISVSSSSSHWIRIRGNDFRNNGLQISFEVNEQETLDFYENQITQPVQFGLIKVSNTHKIQWSQFQGGIYASYPIMNYLSYLSDNDRISNDEATQFFNSVLPESFLTSYLNEYRIQNLEAYDDEVSLLGRFREFYDAKHNTRSANEVFISMKDLETQRLAYLYRQSPSFDTFFEWKVNQFLKIFSNYGTRPSKAITFSVYVVIAFALVYLFFPNHWDSHGKDRILHRYQFFFKYLNKDAGMHDVYLEGKQDELAHYDGFKNFFIENGKTVPKFFLATALPLYRWSTASTRSSSWFLSKIDIFKGKWADLPAPQRAAKTVLLSLAFMIALAYDILIKMLNALMLSINTFTTLGFGEIPIKGLPRYLAIIQGFIGWFMLTIFSVSLISQLLN